MKKLYKIFTCLIIIAFVFIACEDKSDLTAPGAPNTGSADFARFVTIGNSLTQGEQSGSVFETAQEYSFGSLIAKQVGKDPNEFVQSIFPDPGSGGRLEVTSLDPFTLTANATATTPSNITYPAPYNNLGVKGAFLWDVMNTTSSANNYTAQFGAPNAMFDAVLRGSGSQIFLAAAQNPTFITLWIGNNDILAFATRGGLFPVTSGANFQTWYGQILDSLEQIGAQVVVANIPDVTSIPFFKTVGPSVAASIDFAISAGLPVVGLFYQKNQETGPVPQTQFATPDQIRAGDIFLTLTGSSAAGLISDTTGRYYSDNGIPVPAGIVTSAPFGLHPLNPYPDGLVLDGGEIGIAQQAVAGYNGIIDGLVAVKGWSVVDVNGIFSNIAANGLEVDGIKFSTEFVFGGLLSLDGVHPTSQGYAIIANEFIKVIKSKYGATIPFINVSTIPGSLVIGKRVQFNNFGLPIFEPGTFDHILF